MAELAKDFWARADRDLLARWPKDDSGRPEKAVRLDIQWELDSRADLTVSLLRSCGIPAFQNGSLGKVLGGFAAQGVETTVKRFPESFHGFIPHFGAGWQDAVERMVRQICS